MYYNVINTLIGPLTLTSDGEHLTGLWLPGETAPGRDRMTRRADLPIFGETEAWLSRYFAGEDPGETPPLAPAGTPFQSLIWRLLTEIPYGETASYGALARRAAALLGKEKMSAQAVGGAVGRNPISILIPCHRVIGSDKSLTGYGGGLPLKRKLLEIEGFALSEDGEYVL